MKNKYHFVIEVKIPSGCEGWQTLVNAELKQIIEQLRVTVKDLGGKVCIRY